MGGQVYIKILFYRFQFMVGDVLYLLSCQGNRVNNVAWIKIPRAGSGVCLNKSHIKSDVVTNNGHIAHKFDKSGHSVLNPGLSQTIEYVIPVRFVIALGM